MKTFGCEIIHRQDNDSKPRKKNSFRFSFQIDGNNHHHNPKNSLPHAFDKCLTLCSPFWFSPHRNIWKPFTVEKAELLIHNIQAMWRWKINISSLHFLSLSAFSCIFHSMYIPLQHTDIKFMLLNVVASAERFMKKENRLLYCIMFYLKFIASWAKKSKITESEFIYTKVQLGKLANFKTCFVEWI